MRKTGCDAPELKPELHQSMVELGTPVCADIAQAKEELIKQIRFICGLANPMDWKANPMDWKLSLRPPIPLADGPNNQSPPILVT